MSLFCHFTLKYYKSHTMAKAKVSKGTGVVNKAQNLRISFLYQAAAYLATPISSHEEKQDESKNASTNIDTQTDSNLKLPSDAQLLKSHSTSLSRQAISDLRTISLKTQLRLSPGMKHTMCKRCSSLLLDGSTCINSIENKSKHGKKPWADIQVRKCNTCGLEKRTPLSASRQKRRPARATTTGQREQLETEPISTSDLQSGVP
jgi:ribonuclease P protein subunit RPR2